MNKKIVITTLITTSLLTTTAFATINNLENIIYNKVIKLLDLKNDIDKEKEKSIKIIDDYITKTVNDIKKSAEDYKTEKINEEIKKIKTKEEQYKKELDDVKISVLNQLKPIIDESIKNNSTIDYDKEIEKLFK